MKLLFILLASVSFLGACPFCNPAILEKQMVYEGKEAVVLYCLNPLAKGNLLVIPRRHVERFDNLSPSEMLEIHSLVAKMSQAFQDVYSVSDYFILQKNGVLAGQSQAHTHFHLIPCRVHLQKLIASQKPTGPDAISDEEMAERCLELRTYFSTFK